MRLFLIKSYVYNLRYVPISLISIYKKIISPLIIPSCRFHPSCSVYAQLAIERYGMFKGGAMTLVRLSKCHPFYPGGYDPVV